VPLPPGTEAPTFELPSSDAGAPRSLGDLTRDGRAVLAFFKTGCPTCQLAFPVYGELERRYGDEVPVVAVSQDSMAKTVPWLEDKGFAGTALDDESDHYAVSRSYAVTSVPTLVMVDDGEVVATSQGWDREAVNDWARRLGEMTGRETSPVSTEGDGRPAFKPG
jgi:thiol-disulfide isomerase/thioredoxin